MTRSKQLFTLRPLLTSILLCLLPLCVAATAHAADSAAPAQGVAVANPFSAKPSHIAAARDVLTLLRVKDSVPPMVAQLSGLIADQISQWNPPTEQQNEVDKTVAKIDEALASELNWTNLEQDYVVLYTESFSEAELKEIARFFRTPTGQKYVASVPGIQQRTLTIGQLRLQRVQPRIEVILGDLKRHLDVVALEHDAKPVPAPDANAH